MSRRPCRFTSALLALLGLLALAGCGRGNHVPEAEKFVAAFVAEARERGLDPQEDVLGLDIRFDENDELENEGLAGKCFQGLFSRREIILNRMRWEQVGDERRESVLFHELGHCVLDRDHVEDGQRSLMNVPVLPGYEYFHDREYFLNELFGTL